MFYIDIDMRDLKTRVLIPGMRYDPSELVQASVPLREPEPVCIARMQISFT